MRTLRPDIRAGCMWPTRGQHARALLTAASCQRRISNNPCLPPRAFQFTKCCHIGVACGPHNCPEVGRAAIMVPVIHMTTLRSLRLRVWPETAQEVAEPGTELGLFTPCLPLHPAQSNFYQVRPLAPMGIFPL